MRRYFYRAEHRAPRNLIRDFFLGLLVVLSLAACDPKGQTCGHKGDTKATNGHVYTCQYNPSTGGNTWQ